MSKDTEHVDDWEGSAELLHPSDYIRAADIEDAGRAIALTIKRVEKNASLIRQGGQTDLKPVVHFAETPKKLVLNKTNSRRIAELHGKRVADWKGKKISLITEQWRGADLAVRVQMKNK